MIKPASSILAPISGTGIGYIHEHGLYVLLRCQNAQEITDLIKEQILKAIPNALHDLTVCVDDIINRFSLSEYDLALLWQSEDVVYLITNGQGKIAVKRDTHLGVIIHGNKTASGMIQMSDLFIVGFHSFFEKLASENLEHILSLPTVSSIVKDFESSMQDKAEVAIFIKYPAAPLHQPTPMPVNVVQTNEVQTNEPAVAKTTFDDEDPIIKTTLIDHFKSKFKTYSENSSQGKKITIIVAVLLMMLFVWSVGFGIQRRSKSEVAKQIAFYQERIDAKLNEASDLSTLNTERAQILVKEAKQDFQELKNKIGEKNYKQIASLEASIQKKEGEIFKREDKQPEEFYNLNLISDTAQGKKLFLEGDNLSILDTASHQIYSVSVSKKSKESFDQASIKNAKYIASYEGNEFIVTPEGVYKITEDKQELVIKKDDNWGEIKGIGVFNGNIYLLDSGKNNIHKYLVAEKGYSDKSLYFSSTEGIDFSEANSFAIDGSVYVAVTANAYKYTSGVAENFDITLPDNQQLGIVKLFTDENTSKVYLLDKSAGKIYVISKSGEYERQIKSSILKKADDMVVSDEEQGILVLAGNKIYKISLD